MIRSNLATDLMMGALWQGVYVVAAPSLNVMAGLVLVAVLGPQGMAPTVKKTSNVSKNSHSLRMMMPTIEFP